MSDVELQCKVESPKGIHSIPAAAMVQAAENLGLSVFLGGRGEQSRVQISLFSLASAQLHHGREFLMRVEGGDLGSAELFAKRLRDLTVRIERGRNCGEHPVLSVQVKQ